MVSKTVDGLKDDFEHKWDNLHDSSEDLIDQQECPPEEVCQSDIMVEEQRVVTVQANQETETVESSLNTESKVSPIHCQQHPLNQCTYYPHRRISKGSGFCIYALLLYLCFVIILCKPIL